MRRTSTRSAAPEVEVPVPASMRRGHRATHVEGGPVICSCGWRTRTPVRSLDAGQRIAALHVSGEVTP